MKKKIILGVFTLFLVLQAQTVFADSSVIVECLNNPSFGIYGQFAIDGKNFHTFLDNGYRDGRKRLDKIKNGPYIVIVRTFKFNEWSGKWNDNFTDTLVIECKNELVHITCSFDKNGKILNLKVAKKTFILTEAISEYIEKKDATSLDLLLEKYSDDPINMRLEDDNTFLINEIKKPNVNIRNVEFLVRFGAKVNLRNKLGETAASLAYDKGEIEIYNYLKANGAIDFEPRQVAQQPTAPAQSSSTTNVYVQPSAPSQSPSHSPVQTASTEWNLSVMSGTYNIGGTWTSSVGKGNFIVLNGTGSSGSVNIQLNGKAMTGTASISGNNLDLYITSGELKGQQFRYTIVSNKLIQGDGENFSRY